MTAIAPREPVATSKPFNSLRLTVGEDGSTSTGSASESGRPAASRRDTEQILDYYQSEDAGRAYVNPKSYDPESRATSNRELPMATTRATLRPRSAGKDASRDGSVSRTSMDSVASSSGGVQRRTSQRSAGGADKRRVAIVEVDSKRDSSSASSRTQRSSGAGSSTHPLPDRTLLSRRGLDTRLDGLALMTPPDAETSNYYTGPCPVPTSAPATGATPVGRSAASGLPPSGHQRSLSEIQSRKKGGTGSKTSPRDVGIVGTLETMLASSPAAGQTELPQYEAQRPSTADDDSNRHLESCSGSLTAPVFQTPKSRSPSPLPTTDDTPPSPSVTSDLSLSARGWTVAPEAQATPNAGRETDLSRPTVRPPVSDMNPGPLSTRRSPNTAPSGLPIVDLSNSEPHYHGDRDASRTGLLPYGPNQAGPSYLHYQPGIHSTAGPLPSPPRHILTHPKTSPPPRPPRLMSPPPTNRRTDKDQSKRSTRLPSADAPKTVPITSLRPPLPVSRGDSDFSITAVSVSSSGSDEKSPSASGNIEPSSDPSKGRESLDRKSAASSRNGNHVREGAFPASSVFLSHPSQSPLPRGQQHTLDEVVASASASDTVNEEDPLSSSDLSPPTVTESSQPLTRSHSRPHLRRENSWVSISADSLGCGFDDTSPPSSYSSSREGSTRISTTNAASDDGYAHRRSSVPAPPSEQRRFHSLPRTPSILSSHFIRSCASSPSSLPRKPPSSWPDAMNFHDVLIKKTAAERALGYAAKIRELSSEETGLRDWLAIGIRKDRREAPPSAAGSAVNATSRAFSKQNRHVSRSSMASEVTFPIRSDSYTATDLSLRPTTDMSSPTLIPPSLPYPSLAHGVGIRKRSSRGFSTATDSSSLASPAIAPRSLGGAFFASIGRKASIKKDRPSPVISHSKLIPSRQSAPIPQPRPVKIGSPPTIPGGPRAPARQIQRAASALPAPKQNPSPDAPGSAVTPPTAESTETFDRQLERLADLLPQADKQVLALYLRQAPNQDPMLAIGAYLDDEKQGSLRKE